MGKFQAETCRDIDGLLVITPQVHQDSRGYFLESYNKRDLAELGITADFVQDNQSRSTKGVLRGVHYQKEHTQGKLVRVLAGAVFDVAVDIRKNSATFGQWYGVTLTAEKKNMFYLPAGFAHGFYVLSETADFFYQCTDYYDPAAEAGIPWDDKTLNIEWPIPKGQEPILSEKDKHYPSFSADTTL